MRQLSAEGLLALRPTAVLGTDEAGPPPVLAQLRQAGVPLRLVEVQHRFDDVLAKVRLVGEAAQRESAAQHLSARLEAEWQATRAALARSPLRAAPRVLFVMAHGGAPMTSGSGTAADAMIALAGGTNALAGVEGYRPLNAESVVQARPDWVLSTDASLAAVGGAERFWALPGLGLTPAARQRRLLAPDAMALLGFGPRMPAALAELHRAFA
jgi:iron complex transport system substrate-binding protein